MQETQFAVPEFVTADDIRRVRKKLGLTQKRFAELTGCSKPTIERWEAGDGRVTGPIVLLLQMLENNPSYAKELDIPEKTTPIRLFYMHNQRICTLIDVDESLRSVRIINYTKQLMFRAFGANEEPSFEEYEAFLESRCFPRTRDKLKWVLEDMELPCYDPFLIVEKTNGRMAEDDFWVKIER